MYFAGGRVTRQSLAVAGERWDRAAPGFDLHPGDRAGQQKEEGEARASPSAPVLQLGYPIGVLETFAPVPLTLARITPDWSVKNMRCPVCPTAMGVAVSV